MKATYMILKNPYKLNKQIIKHLPKIDSDLFINLLRKPKKNII